MDEGIVSTSGWSCHDDDGGCHASFGSARSGRLVVVAEALGERARSSGAAHEATRLLLDAAPRDLESTVAFVGELRPTLSGLNRHLLPVGSRDGHPSLSHAVSLAMLAFCDSGLVVANMADTRCYFSRAGKLESLTRETVEGGSEVEEVLASALRRAFLPEDQRIRLARALGVVAPLVPDITVHTLRRGDRCLLCTGGLWAAVEPQHLARVLMSTSTASTVADAVLPTGGQGVRADAWALTLSEYLGPASRGR